MGMYRSNSFPKLQESFADDAGDCLAVQYKEPSIAVAASPHHLSLSRRRRQTPSK